MRKTKQAFRASIGARHQQPNSGFRQKGPLEKFVTVSPTSYPQAEVSRCAHNASAEANEVGEGGFFSGRLDGLAKTAISP